MLNTFEKEALKDTYNELLKSQKLSLKNPNMYISGGAYNAYKHSLKILKTCFPLEVAEFEKELETQITL